MRLLPREHGAYGQMALPLVTSLAIAGATASAVLMTTAVVAAFQEAFRAEALDLPQVVL